MNVSHTYRPHHVRYKRPSEVGKLLTAAVVSEAFRQLLLTNPAQALADGYNGIHFALTSQEEERLLAIKAASLSDLALQLGNGHDSRLAPVAQS